MARGRGAQLNLLSQKEFAQRLRRLNEGVKGRQRDIYRAMGFAVFESLQVGSAGGGINPYTGSPGTPVDTSFARNSWWLSVGGGGRPLPAAVRDAEDQGAGALAMIQPLLLALPLGVRVTFVNNAAYIIPLEYGHSTQAPRGFIRLTTTGAQNVLNAIVMRVVAARRL